MSAFVEVYYVTECYECGTEYHASTRGEAREEANEHNRRRHSEPTEPEPS